MNYTLEMILLPVTDVDRAKEFYADKMGFSVDVDHRAGDAFRIVQLTPPGSACSIAFGIGVTRTEATVQGLHLVVPDIERAKAELGGRGVEVGEIQHFDGSGGPVPGPHPERADYGSYLFLSDPDGNGWAVQEVASRGSGA